MDDNNKIVSQNVSSATQADQSQSQAAVQPIQPAVSAGSVNKEAGPVGVSDSEFIKPTDAEPQISQELKESGVEVKSDRPNLTFEHKKLGIDHAGPSVSVSASPSSSIQYPMSEEEVASQLKTGQNDDSGKWLAGLIQKIIKAIGI